MSSPENAPQDPISSFIDFRPDIYEFFGGRKLVFQVLKTMGLLNLTCPRGHEMVFREDRVDNPKMGYCSQCKQYFSVLTNTFFARKKIRSIDEFFLVLFFFCSRAPQTVNMNVVNMKEETVSKYMRAINEICSTKVVNMKNDGLKIGGPGKIVEIDEVHLAERKYMRGTELVSEHFWVFGMIEVEGGWIEFEDEELYKRLIKSEKAKILQHAQEVLDKAAKKKRAEGKKPRKNVKKMTMKEFKMLVKDVLNTDLHRNYEGNIRDVYDIITLPTETSDDIDLKDNPLTPQDKETIKVMFSQKKKDKWTGNVLFFMVKNRSEEDLLPLIIGHVHPASIIMSDKWGAYNLLPMFFESHSISHKYRFSQFIFKKGEKKALRKTTNHMERCWVDVRRFLSGTHEKDIQMKLDVETSRYMVLNNEDSRKNMVRFLEELRTN